MSNGRRTFVLSRGLEYFSESELLMQIGRPRWEWPVAILKELIDNALDAAESVDTEPVVSVTTSEDGFTVRDNGPGIPESTISGSLDYNIRVSDKLGYVTPTRGRLGNALMVVWAAPYVDQGQSQITIRTQGRRHDISVRLDRIEQCPAVEHDVHEDDFGSGTEITIQWPDSASLLAGEEDVGFYKNSPTARSLIQDFAAFNPHATFTLDGETIAASSADWKKWRPSDLCPHWYTPDTFRELIAHYVASERYGASPVTVREFVSSFRGLTSTAKQKTVTEGFKRDHLSELVVDDGRDLDQAALETLLERMKAETRPPRPSKLGVIGREHLSRWLVEQAGASKDSIKYRKKTGVEDDLPYVVEVAFGVHEDDDAGRRIVTGLNWSPTLGVPVHQIDSLVQEMRIDPTDPVILLVHMARPEWKYTERGKGRVNL